MTQQTETPVQQCGAKPPYSVNYIDPEVCGGGIDRWFVMGTVNGDPRDQCGPVAVCEYEPSAHVIAALLNATGGTSAIPVECDKRGPGGECVRDHEPCPDFPAPPAESWVDKQGDVWRLGDDGLMHTPETAPFPREHVERKWGPLRIAREVTQA